MRNRCVKKLIIVITFVISTFGKVYYVDSANGNDTGDGQSVSTAWKTINKANQQLQPGDTVYIRKGTYSESIRPGNSGTEDLRITYKAYQDERVLLSGVTVAVNLKTLAYITVDGIDIEKVDRYVAFDSCHHAWIANGTFDNHNSPEGWPVGIIFKNNSHHNKIYNCTIGRVGYCTSNDDKGGVMTIGVWSDTLDHCDYNLLENNVFFYGGHHIIEVVGSYNIIRNNYFHNEEWMDCEQTETGGICGNRLIIIGYNPRQVNRNLIEGNRFAFSGVPPDGNTSSGINLRTPHHIVRNNVFYYNDGPGFGISTMDSTYDARFIHVYNNTLYHNGFVLLSGVEIWKQGGMLIAKHGNSTPTTNLSIKNNLLYDNKADPIVFYYVERDSQVVEGNWEKSEDPQFKDITSNVDPFISTLPDFNLQQTSPCIDSGVFLTRINSPDGSGTQFQVEDAGYFTDGWGVIAGDLIQLEGQTERVRITNVDYTTNTLTVDKSVAWTDNLGVASPYEGSGPDIGAFEYGLINNIKNTYPWKSLSASKCAMDVVSLNGGIRIKYATDNPEKTTIAVYDLSGRLIRQLPVKSQSGLHEIFWKGSDSTGKKCANRCFIITMRNDTMKTARKVVLFR